MLTPSTCLVQTLILHGYKKVLDYVSIGQFIMASCCTSEYDIFYLWQDQLNYLFSGLKHRKTW